MARKGSISYSETPNVQAKGVSYHTCKQTG